VASRGPVTRALLESIADFAASQKSLDRPSLLASAEALMRAAQGTAAYTDAGHAYWSPDVAQHHQYRGQGRVDQGQLEERHAEVERVAVMVEALRSFGG
jgi:hypothetical protein